MNKKLLLVLLLVVVLCLSLTVVGCMSKNGKSENGIPLCVESDKAVIEAITGYPFWDYYNTPGAQLGYSALLFGNSGCSSYVLEYKSPYPCCWGVYLTESCSTQAVAFLRDNQGVFMKDANNYPFSDFSDDGIIDGKIWYAYQQSDHFSQSDYIVIRASNYEEFKDIPGYKLVLCVIGKELIIHQDLRGNQYERTMPLYCRKVLRYGEHGLEASDDFLRAQGEQLLFAYEGCYLEVGRSDFVEQSVAYIPQRGIGAYTRTISAQMKLIDDQLFVLLPQYVDYGWGSVDLLSADTNQIDPRDDLFGVNREVFSKTLVETCVQSTGNYTLSWFDYDGIRRVLETQTDSFKMTEDYRLAWIIRKLMPMDTYELNMQLE